MKFFRLKIESAIVRIVYGALIIYLNYSNFLEIINANLDKLDTSTKKLYVLGDFNIHTYQNNKCIVRDDKMISSKIVSVEIENYRKLRTVHSLKQLTKSLNLVALQL